MQKKIINKSIYFCLVITILSGLFINFLSKETQAVQVKEPEATTTKLSQYPGYTELINNLKKAHPSWTFTIFYTGLDWNQVIKNETVARHGRNLVSASKTGEWLCSICESNDVDYDGGSWKCASATAVSYYMDPRNSLNEDYIFQFEELGYNSNVHTIAGVQAIISDCSYLQGSTIKYIKTDGTTGTINKSYAQLIMDVAKQYSISPYHLATRIRQEQGTTGSALISGNYNSTYRGCYNFFNIDATASSGSTASDVIKNGLEYAKNNKWFTPEDSIKAGASFLAESYIKDGQSTLYLQKFDVDNSDGELYWFQYMQNVSASKSEGSEIKATYTELGLINDNIPYNFLIPVYENMPEDRCPYPESSSIVTQNVEIIGDGVIVRSTPSTSGTEIARLNKRNQILRIEISSSTANGYTWDKVVLSNGKKGYIATNYLKKIADITTCSEKAIINATEVSLRNGPGTSNTTVKDYLTKGQSVTIIEKDKYKNLDGYNWYRIVLADGTQGYVAATYLSSVTNGSDSSGNEIVKVICNSGVNVREEPGTDSRVLTHADKGETLTRTAKAVSTKNGYTWDKVVTSGGIIGYIARGDSTESYIQVITQTTSKTFEIQNSSLISVPSVTVANIKATYSDAVIKKGNTTITSGNIGTGYTVTTGGKTYTIIVFGDVNGDGNVNSGDTLSLKQHVGKIKSITNTNYLKAADINKDGNINSGDSLIAKQHVGKVKNISL